jgi:hypothetical protein
MERLLPQPASRMPTRTRRGRADPGRPPVASWISLLKPDGRGRRRHGGVVVASGGGEEAEAAERAGGVVVVQPGLQAGPVEEVPAGEPVHHRLRLEPGQAHAAIRAGAAAPPPEPRRAEPAPEPVREARTQGRDRRHHLAVVVVLVGGGEALPRRRRGQAQEHQRRAHQPRQDRDRHRRVVQDEPHQAVLGRRHARDAHPRCPIRQAPSTNSRIPRAGLRMDLGGARPGADCNLGVFRGGEVGGDAGGEDWDGSGGFQCEEVGRAIYRRFWVWGGSVFLAVGDG